MTAARVLREPGVWDAARASDVMYKSGSRAGERSALLLIKHSDIPHRADRDRQRHGLLSIDSAVQTTCCQGWIQGLVREPPLEVSKDNFEK